MKRPATIYDATIWSNIDMYRDSDTSDIAMLVYRFFNFLRFTVANLMQMMYFDHEK